MVRKPVAVTPLIVLVSLITFVLLRAFVSSTLYYDDSVYYAYATQIANDGLDAFASDLRTYLYPWLISLPVWLLGDDALRVQWFVAGAQFALLVASVLWIVRRVGTVIGAGERARHVAAAGVLLNPYLLFACHRLLTDLGSACLAGVGLVIVATTPLRRGWAIGLGFAFLAMATMLRPSAIVFLAVAAIALAWRARGAPWRDVVVSIVFATIATAAVVAPQIRMNERNYHTLTPLPAGGLYGLHAKNAIRFLRYETVIEEGVPPARFTLNPIAVEPGRSATIYAALIDQPIAALVAIAGHVYFVVNWDRPQTYIPCVDCQVGRAASIAILAFQWLLVATGLVAWLRARRWRVLECVSIGACVVYVAAMSTVIVEARFGYPLILVSLVFAIAGADVLLARASTIATRARFALAWLGVFAAMYGGALAMERLVGPAALWM